MRPGTASAARPLARPALSGELARPVVHQPPTALEQVQARIGGPLTTKACGFRLPQMGHLWLPPTDRT